MAMEPQIDDFIKKRLKSGANPITAQALFNERIAGTHSNKDVRFTDGSKLPGRVGIGIYSRNYTEHRSLSNVCSVFSAESAAISQALAYPSKGPILIATDASVLLAVASPTQ